MNYRTHKILEALDRYTDLTYDTGWMAGAMENGRTDLNQGVQQYKIDERNKLKFYLEEQIKELGDALEEAEAK